MMNEEEITEEGFQKKPLGVVLSLYFLPAVIVSLFAQYVQDSFSILSFGLLVGTGGSFLFYNALQKWQQNEPTLPPLQLPSNATPDYTPYIQQVESLQKAVKEAEDHNLELTKENEKLKDNLQVMGDEKEASKQQEEVLQQEFLMFKETVQKEVDHKHEVIIEHQRTIADLREVLENKQQHIVQLESKTRDLNYELKVLLQLTETPLEVVPPPSIQPKISAQSSQTNDNEIHLFDFAVRTQEEAHVHLKRVLDVAQRITGTSPFGSSPRFKDLPLDNYALDLRRLLDCLKEVNATTIFVFSLKENKMLFVNDHVKDLLGVTPEKFMVSFQETSQEAWQEAIRQLAFKNEAKVYLTLKNKSGQDTAIDALISPVPTGIFKNHLIGILYPSAKR